MHITNLFSFYLPTPGYKKFFSQTTIKRTDSSNNKDSKDNKLKDLEKKIQDTDENSSINRVNLTTCFQKIGDLLENFSQALEPFMKGTYDDAINNRELEQSKLEDDFSKLKSDDSNYELNKNMLHKKWVETEVRSEEFVNHLFHASQIPMDEASREVFRRLQREKSLLLNEERKLRKEYLASLEEKTKLLAESKANTGDTGEISNKDTNSKKGSLVDDYADVSTQHPSYMDPED
jgi:hypothetical protein